MTPTLTFIVLSLVVIFGVDLWFLVKKGYSATISATLYRLARGNPIVPFLFGVLMGHLFWNLSGEEVGRLSGDTPASCEEIDRIRGSVRTQSGNEGSEP